MANSCYDSSFCMNLIKACFCIISDYTYIIYIGWIRIRIRMDPELLPGSGTRKIQSRIRNKSFRIHNTGFLVLGSIRILQNEKSVLLSIKGSAWLGNLFSCSAPIFCRWLQLWSRRENPQQKQPWCCRKIAQFSHNVIIHLNSLVSRCKLWEKGATGFIWGHTARI